MNRILTPVLIIVLTCCAHMDAYSQLKLKVSSDGRHLIKSDGTPFFWMGDTAWELFHRLTREEAVQYFRIRSKQGFNLVQAVVLAEFDGLTVPNAYGHFPLEQFDPTRPQEPYFQHVDFVIDQASKHGLYIGLLPTWGDKLNKGSWGAGPEIFNTANAFSYGQWLGSRYKNKTNVVWILGGDRNPRHNQDVEVWRSMAKGIIETAGQEALLTFHPQPTTLEEGGSSHWFHADSWLSINMFQTGHCVENNVWDRIQVAYQKQPAKPIINGESIYEDHPVCFNANELGTSSAYNVRRDVYLSLFAGATGHTYGCHDVWQMYAPHRTPVNGPHYPWYVAVDLPAANQMKYVRHLMESRPILERIPDQSMVLKNFYEHDRIQATRGKDYIFVYSTQGQPISLKLGIISGQMLNSYFYNPKSGKTRINKPVPNTGTYTFECPDKGYGHDWILVLDDASKKYTDPAYVEK